MKHEELLVSLAESLEAGVPPAVLARSPALSLLPPVQARRVAHGLETGKSLSATLESLEVLPPASVAILRAAEAHGGLPAGLRLVATRLAEARTEGGRLVLLLTYPALLLLVAALVLPVPVLFRAGVAEWARASLPYAGVVVGAFLLFTLVALSSSPFARALRGWLALSLPLVRSAGWHAALGDFSQVLGACLTAGVPVRAALVLASDAAAAPAIAQAGPALVERLDAGASLAEALAAAIPRFPADLLGQLHAAEHAGTLDLALARTATTCAARSRRATIVTMVVLTAIVLVGAAGVVGYAIVRGFEDTLQQTDQAIDELMKQR